MAYINRNEFGTIIVNDKVIVDKIVGEILDLSDLIIPCNKKGKIIKSHPTPFIDPDNYDSVEYIDTRKNYRVIIYFIVKFGVSINDVVDEIVKRINGVFNFLNLKTPDDIIISIKGIKTLDNIAKKDIEIIRKNEH